MGLVNCDIGFSIEVVGLGILVMLLVWGLLLCVCVFVETIGVSFVEYILIIDN